MFVASLPQYPRHILRVLTFLNISLHHQTPLSTYIVLCLITNVKSWSFQTFHPWVLTYFPHHQTSLGLSTETMKVIKLQSVALSLRKSSLITFPVIHIDMVSLRCAMLWLGKKTRIVLVLERSLTILKSISEEVIVQHAHTLVVNIFAIS